ncbi:MAG: hypothetical protein QJR10_07480 [Bacillota bacterium]|jgi:hypothetical protein|nr:hypothetical protein [Pseudacidobacterium ailaaui]MDI3254608.1 hypothetical protein [Bacillota bacterium]
MRYLDANFRWQALLLSLVLLAGGPVASPAQQQQQLPQIPAPASRPTSPGQPGMAGDDSGPDPLARRIMLEQAKKRNQQRQQDIVNDTNKLLQLAQQLKAEVDKTNQDQLSLSVIKKAEEIEKLAKSVKEKMKGS